MTVKKRSPDVLLIVNLVSEDDPGTGRPQYDQLYLSNYATINLQDPLRRIEGVGDIFPSAGRITACVWLDPAKLASRNLTAGDVSRVLLEQNAGGGRAARPAPHTQRPGLQYTLSTLGRLVEPEQFADIILTTGTEGEVTYLKDVGAHRAGRQEPGPEPDAGR